ncbi:MAG TPA: hypothetical protein VK610_08810, partial [Rhodothermales bacterium]|nr:hypothetical protein [Rhodothermales bacterium]
MAEPGEAVPAPGRRALAADLLARVEPRHLAAFHEALPAWFTRVRRHFPWREETDGRRDPYRVWLS